MTAIIRVKRHLQDDPVEALRLECKRRRTEEAGDSPSFEKVLNFVGTVDKKEDFVSQRTLGISSVYQKKVKELKNRKPDILSKVRKENKNRSEENRFKVISCMRSTHGSDELDSNSEELPKDVTILDVNLEKPDDSKSGNVCNSEDNYVYDLYSANFEDYSDIYLDDVVGIEAYISENVFDMQYRNAEDYSDDTYDPDEDDSNDENNWRNFYPDEEGSDSEEIDVLTDNFRKFGRDDSYDLSSDEGEEKYLNYSDPNNKKDYYYTEAENLGGSSYAKYKMSVLDTFKPSESFDGDEEEETY